MAGQQHPTSLILLNFLQAPDGFSTNPNFSDHYGLYNPDPHLGLMQQDHPFPPACVDIFPFKIPPFQLAHQEITTLMEQDGAEALPPPGSPL